MMSGMTGRMGIWAGLIVALAAMVGLGVYLAAVGLDSADKLASVIGLFVAIAGLGAATYALFAERRRGGTGDPGMSLVSAGGERSVAIGGDNTGIVSTGDGAVNTILTRIVSIPRSIRVALLVLVTVALVTEGGWIAYRWVVPQFRPIYKTQFLIDATGGAGSGGPAAITASLKAVVGNAGDRDALALRSFGGECGADDNTTQLVGFGTGNRPKIAEAADKARAGGKPTLLRGIVEAVQDFSKPLALGARQVNRIIVVTRHGADACDDDAEFVEKEIRDRISAAHLAIQFRLIGYRVPKAQRDRLRRIAAGTKAPEPAFADTPASLNADLNWFTNVEPVVREAEKIIGILNPAVERVNDAVQAIDDRRFDAAKRSLDQARSAANATDTAFEDLQGRTKTPAERDIGGRASRLRVGQRRVVAAAVDLLDAARSGSSQAAKAAVFQQVAGDYNAQVNAMNQALARLRAASPVTR